MKVKVDENEFDVDAVKAKKCSKPAPALAQTEETDSSTTDSTAENTPDTTTDT